jgi:predicted signal transduction protein with EAL and GGDEF domain
MCRTTDLAARLGGATFALLIDDRDGSAAAIVAQRVADRLARPMVVADVTLKVSGHVGVATDPAGAESADTLLQRAQLAVLWSRNSGLRAPTTFVPDMLAASDRATLIESGLLTSFQSGAARLAYQPIVDVADGSIVLVEALSRWTHETLGPLDPAELVEIAERCGLIGPLTEWTLRTACADLAEWRRDPDIAGEPVVAVNVSPAALGAERFPSVVMQCLKDAGLPPSALILEVTESAVHEGADVVWTNAEKLASAGVRFAVDDFGAGHSSLARVAALPLTTLKLDRSIVARAGEPAGPAIIRASVAVAFELGLDLVAEGVESAEQLAALVDAGCRLVQGFHLAHPLGEADLRALLKVGRCP